ncbi:DUF6643 family protein, partial [Streptomyces olivaceus]
MAGLLAYGYHRPCSAFPDRKRSSGCPLGPVVTFPPARSSPLTAGGRSTYGGGYYSASFPDTPIYD